VETLLKGEAIFQFKRKGVLQYDVSFTRSKNQGR